MPYHEDEIELCTDCDNPIDDCRCNSCNHCGGNRDYCDCVVCEYCQYLLDNCHCEFCKVCGGRIGHDCKCSNDIKGSNTKKILPANDFINLCKFDFILETFKLG